ncbi:hypothetical protein THTE_4082 [Thermogutta terrifontis]|uniref:Uncharacterized protein n=1 Tax=Thermogutta terrifontis TaxID=1331910 RepID=A0A286RL44_9BACT|nr:hypothetical protein THTE_4082 [Thermogutta terrifontis]
MFPVRVTRRSYEETGKRHSSQEPPHLISFAFFLHGIRICE